MVRQLHDNYLKIRLWKNIKKKTNKHFNMANFVKIFFSVNRSSGKFSEDFAQFGMFK